MEVKAVKMEREDMLTMILERYGKDSVFHKVFRDVVLNENKSFSSHLRWLMTLSLGEAREITSLTDDETCNFALMFAKLPYSEKRTPTEVEIELACTFLRLALEIDSYRRYMIIDIRVFSDNLSIGIIKSRNLEKASEKDIKKAKRACEKFDTVEDKIIKLGEKLAKEREEEK